MPYIPIKYDTTHPTAPSSVTITQNPNGYAWNLNINFAASADRWTKVYWDIVARTNDEVHNAPYGNSIQMFPIRGYSRTIPFNQKAGPNKIYVPWNTSGYFSVISYDQSYMDSYGSKNPSSLTNYSAVTVSNIFCSAAEYIDISNLKIDYRINYSVTDKLNANLKFDGYDNSSLNMSGLWINCKSNSNVYYDRNGSETVPTYYEKLAYPEAFTSYVNYKLPYNDGKNTYIFNFLTINGSGNFSGNGLIDSYNTQIIEETLKQQLKTATPIRDDKIYNIEDFRKRCAVYISNIETKKETFTPQGNFISKPYLSTKPIYAVQLYCSELFDFLDEFPNTPESYITYYLSFLDNDKWYRISPVHRKNETWINSTDKYDENLKYVPNIIILDSNLSSDEQLKNIVNKNVAYINFSKSIYNIRIKISMNNNGDVNISPKISDYNIKIITRDILKSNIIEEDIRNV